MFKKYLSTHAMSSTRLFALLSAYFTLVLNLPFYREVLNIHPFTGAPIDYFLFTIPLFIFFALNACFQLIALPFLHKILMPLLLILSAVISYNELIYHIYFDSDMLNNVLQTHTAEALNLVTLPFVLWVAILGILPALLYLRTQIIYRKPLFELLARLGAILVSLLVIIGIAKFFYQDYASFLRNNKQAAHLILPSNFINAVIKKSKQIYNSNRTFESVGLDSKQQKPDNFRHVTIVVMGETTRAQNWGLNGYNHNTTPLLAKRNDVINFPHVSSCGTHTAYSLPCLFSDLPRTEFNNDDAPYRDNLLDILQRAGVAVQWFENDGGCKDVCNRVPNKDMTELNLSQYCKEGECLDEILFQDLDKTLNATDKDTLIVLHTIGSHGPTYYQRYPANFRQFTPTCDTNEINQCSNEQLINTYDNSILYVDYIVNKAIERLAKESNWESTLLYLSDHGESLGENGLYLHATPYAIAPEQQTHIPMVMWFSPLWRQNEGVDMQCLQRKAQTGTFSHDNFFHSIIGMLDMDLHLTAYRPELDILAQCKK